MLSKFKVKSVDGGNFLTHFRHNREQNCAPAQIQPSLTEVYEAEIRRLREENHNLRIQHNSITNQLNEVVVQLQRANAERTLLKQRIAETDNVFYNTKKCERVRGSDLRWTSIPSRRSRNTSSCFMLQTPG